MGKSKKLLTRVGMEKVFLITLKVYSKRFFHVEREYLIGPLK